MTAISWEPASTGVDASAAISNRSVFIRGPGGGAAPPTPPVGTNYDYHCNGPKPREAVATLSRSALTE